MRLPRTLALLVAAAALALPVASGCGGISESDLRPEPLTTALYTLRVPHGWGAGYVSPSGASRPAARNHTARSDLIIRPQTDDANERFAGVYVRIGFTRVDLTGKTFAQFIKLSATDLTARADIEAIGATRAVAVRALDGGGSRSASEIRARIGVGREDERTALWVNVPDLDGALGYWTIAASAPAEAFASVEALLRYVVASIALRFPTRAELYE